ncbi:hypothetical protein EHI2019_000811900 [Entamoeba histolytica]
MKEEIHQIEEWTEEEINSILFDSYYDDWNKNTSVFGERVMNKEHLIIIIEDEEGNKFGEYVNSKIDKVSTGEWINGSSLVSFNIKFLHSFLFLPF